MPTSHKLQTKSNFAQQMMQILSRPVGALGCKAPPDFGRSIYHMYTGGGEDIMYPPCLLLAPPLQLFRPSYGPAVSMTS